MGSQRRSSRSSLSSFDRGTRSDDISFALGDEVSSTMEESAEFVLHLQQSHHDLGKQQQLRSDSKESAALAGKETKTVKYLEILLFGVLALSTIGVSLAVYYVVSKNEQDKFETHFEQGALKILKSVGQNIETTLAALDVLIISMISFAHATNQTWPMVTIDDFAVRTSKIRPLSNLIFINHLPLVSPEQREEWEKYSLDNSDWVERSMKIQEQDKNYHGPVIYDFDIYGSIHGDFGDVPYNTTRKLLPNWQVGPVVPVYYPFNYDYLSVTNPESLYATLNSKRSIISEAYGLPDESNPDEVAEAEIWFDWYRNYIPDHESSKEPVSDLYMPIFETDLDTVQINPDEHEVVGMIAATWFWRDLIKDLLPEDHQGFVVVFENPCNPSFTYQVDGPVTTYLGRGDLHDTRYDKYDGIHSEIKDLGSFSLSDSRHSFVPVNEEYCQFHISIYPSETMEASFTSQDPVIYMCVAILIFVFTSLLFVGFDFMVRRRHKVVLSTAETSNAVVSSLYPEEVRDRIKQTHIDKKQKSKLKKIEKARRASTSRDRLTALRKQMKSGEDWDSAASLSDSGMFLFDDDNEVTKLDGSPIAEVYSETTVMMADIVGFPAWSSAREPIKVFSLLEAIYSAFDTLSSSYDVFKIESVGDMYVAVSGLPTPERRHAVIMAQFAQACLETVKRIVLRLESKLGPGTADLRLRVGLNSGPVTGGVLRNDKAIFQIFGDTVNVANKMLSTSIEDRIQASQKTAKELMNAGRDHWVFRRLEDSSDPIEKGPEESVLKTYWVEPPGERKSSTISNMSRHDSDIDLNEEDQSIDQLPATVQRLVTWNLGQLESILVKLLKQTPKREAGACLEYRSTKLPRSERSETIFLLNTESTSGTKVGSPSKDSLVLDVGVQHLLSDFISSVAFMYQEKKSLPYHNFEHSANAAMSALKMLSTLAPIQEKSMKNDSDLRITYIHLVLSDPMVQLAIVFAMLVHSLEHRGCPNSELVRQNDPCSKQYEGKSITEQHSIDTAWDLFMDPGYKDLRSMMFRKSTDIMEFRRLFVNSVIATDLEDAELKASQEARWRELFEDRLVVDGDSLPDSSTPESRYKTEFNHNRRAALIIEMIIQVSVISEYTQHWKVYEKQRRHQFKEIYQYSAISNVGRRRGSPSCEKGDTTWYDKELAFFDKFVIPLLKKTKLSGVFWESSIGMMLDYAQQNRAQWAEQGQDLIQKWIEEMGSPASSKPRG